MHLASKRRNRAKSNPRDMGRLRFPRTTALRFCLPWNPDSVNFRGSGMTERLTVLALFGVNQKHGGNQWLFVADVERRWRTARPCVRPAAVAPRRRRLPLPRAQPVE